MKFIKILTNILILLLITNLVLSKRTHKLKDPSAHFKSLQRVPCKIKMINPETNKKEKVKVELFPKLINNFAQNVVNSKTVEEHETTWGILFHLIEKTFFFFDKSDISSYMNKFAYHKGHKELHNFLINYRSLEDCHLTTDKTILCKLSNDFGEQTKLEIKILGALDRNDVEYLAQTINKNVELTKAELKFLMNQVRKDANNFIQTQDIINKLDDKIHGKDLVASLKANLLSLVTTNELNTSKLTALEEELMKLENTINIKKDEIFNKSRQVEININQINYKNSLINSLNQNLYNHHSYTVMQVQKSNEIRARIQYEFIEFKKILPDKISILNEAESACLNMNEVNVNQNLPLFDSKICSIKPLCETYYNLVNPISPAIIINIHK